MRIVCERSGKSTFGTPETATAAMNASWAAVKRPVRVYRCPFCGFFHLTSRTIPPVAPKERRT